MNEEYKPIERREGSETDYKFKNEQELVYFYANKFDPIEIDSIIKEVKSEHFGIRTGQEKMTSTHMLKKIETKLLKKMQEREI